MPGELYTEAGYADLFRRNGLDGESVFTDPRIRVWRSLPDRQNAVLDLPGENGRSIRLHVKRYPRPYGFMARREIRGFGLLNNAGVPVAPIVAHGFGRDRSSFVVLEDLSGYTPADKLLERGFGFDRSLNPTADLAALLHDKGLHHRDLYLCHFMVKPTEAAVDAKLIDMARVDRLHWVLTRRRWIIKDLGQFWYSTRSLPVTDEQRLGWLRRYCEKRQMRFEVLIEAIQRKADAIARHDMRLRKHQPNRNISLPANTHETEKGDGDSFPQR